MGDKAENIKSFIFEQGKSIYCNGKIVGEVMQDRGSVIVVKITDDEIWKEVSASANIKLEYSLIKETIKESEK